MITASGGAGGAGTTVDHDALRETATELRQAGSSMDATGGSAPSTGGCGDAGALLAMIVAAFAETGARLVVETQTMSQTVEECNSAYETTDQAEAEAYLVAGDAR